MSQTSATLTGTLSRRTALPRGWVVSPVAHLVPRLLGFIMYVSPHFNSDEWKQPARYGLDEVAYPDEWILPRLLVLCDLLEELRHYLLSPIYIISGYRTVEWNDRHIAAGHDAAKGSMHIHGLAADIKARSFSALHIHRSIISLHSYRRIRVGGLGLYSSFVHVDVRYILPEQPTGLVQWKG